MESVKIRFEFRITRSLSLSQPQRGLWQKTYRSSPFLMPYPKPKNSWQSLRSCTPSEALVRLAFRGAAAYQLSWFDSHLWANAEHYGLDQLISEDF